MKRTTLKQLNYFNTLSVLKRHYNLNIYKTIYNLFTELILLLTFLLFPLGLPRGFRPPLFPLGLPRGSTPHLIAHPPLFLFFLTTFFPFHASSCKSAGTFRIKTFVRQHSRKKFDPRNSVPYFRLHPIGACRFNLPLITFYLCSKS